MKFNKILLTMILVVVMSGLICAQATSSKIMGKVTDQEGAVLPGVTVTATSPRMVGSAVSITDENGVFRLLSLRPGNFTVKFELEGFGTIIRKNILITVEQTLALNVKLSLQKIEEAITVEGEAPMIDVKSTTQGMTLTKDVFQALPKGRNFDSLVTAVPGVSNEGFLSGISVDGASGAENMYYIDGTDVTNMVDGDRGQEASFDFAEEVQVKASGYQAEFGGSLGGVINVITRSGGNEFHGELIGYYSGSMLAGKERDRLDTNWEDTSIATYYSYEQFYGKEDWYRAEAGFNLGGYIIKDKLWFFGSFLPVFRSNKREIAFSGTDVTKNFETKRTNLNFMFKLSAQPFKNVRWNASVVNNFYKRRGANPISGYFYPNTNYGPRGNSEYNFDAEGYDWPNISANTSFDITIGNNLMITLRGGMFKTNQNNQQVFATEPCWQFITPAPGGYFSTTNIGLLDVPASYQHPSGWRNYSRGNAMTLNKNIAEKYSANVDLNYFLSAGGEHSIKVGFGFVRQGQDVDNVANYPVVFIGWDYTNIMYGKDWGRGKYGYYGVRGNDVTGPYGDNYKPYSNRLTLYLQDSWTIGDKLTLNFGVRTESEYIPSYSDAEGYKDVKPIEFKFADKLAPRIGFIYDVYGDSSLKIFGNYGLFFDVMKLDMAVGSYGGFKWKTAYYTLDTYEWDTIGVNGNFPGDYQTVLDFRTPSFDTTDPDLKPMSQQAISIGAEKKLSENLSASIRVVNKHLRYAIEDIGVLTPEGEVYYTSNPGYGYSRLVKNGGEFDNKFPETPKAKREYWAMNLALEKRFSNNWMGGFSYTFSSLKGNYSGLATSDEPGRNDPNVARYFDLWYLAYKKDLSQINGPLATDRPHYFKAYGSYAFSNGLTIGGVINAMSGQPVSEEWAMAVQGYLPYGRGSEGRTPFLWFANAYIEYNLKLGTSTLQFNLNIDNLFNVSTAQRIWQIRNQVEILVTDDQILANDWDYPTDADAIADPRYGMKTNYYPPISARFGVKFMF